MRKIIMIAAVLGFAASAFAADQVAMPARRRPVAVAPAAALPIPLKILPVGTPIGTVLDPHIFAVNRVAMPPAIQGEPCEISVFTTLEDGSELQLTGYATRSYGILEPQNVNYQNGRVEMGRFALVGQHMVLLEIRGAGGALLGLFRQITDQSLNPITGPMVGFGLEQMPGTGWYVTNGNALASFPNISTYDSPDLSIFSAFIAMANSPFNALNFLRLFVSNPDSVPDAARKTCVGCNEVSQPRPLDPRSYPPRGPVSYDPYHDGSIRHPR
jgi:hypothetical protein